MDHKTEEFLNLIDQHKKLIYKIVNGYCKDREVHEDLTQEIILQLWTAFETYDNKFKYSTWIYRIALNTAISFYRQRKNERKYASEFLPQHENALIKEEPIQEDSNIQLLNQFIQELKEIDKAIILLYLDGYSHNEMAEIIGISATNVGTKITRIKKALHKKFQTKLKLKKNGR